MTAVPTAVPMDKYLGGSQIASQQSIEAVVSRIFEEAIGPRDQQLNEFGKQVGAKLQQLEAAIGQVALAAQQQKMSPFEVALKTLNHFGDDEVDEAAKRCHDKAVALIERWLDAGLATSEAGAGEPGGSAGAAGIEEAQAPKRDDGDSKPPLRDQAQEVSAEDH